MHIIDRRRDRWRVRILQLGTGQCGQVTRQPQDTEAVAAVRRQVDVDDGVGQCEKVDQRGACLRVVRQFHDAVRVVSEAEFDRRTQHAIGDHAANLRLAQLHAIRQRDARLCERGFQPDTYVRSAADDVEQRAAAVGDLADAELVGIRVSAAFDDLTDDDIFERLPLVNQAVDLVAEHGQPMGEFLGGHVGTHPLAKP